MGFVSDESGGLGIGWFNLGLCCFQRNVPNTGVMAVTYQPGYVFAATGGVSPAGELAVVYNPNYTFAATGSVAVSGTLAVDYTPAYTFAATGAVGADLAITGTMAATYSPTLTFAGTGELGAPTLVSATFTDNNDGQPADLDLAYSGFVTGWRVYIATGTASLSVTAAQLHAGSGGTGTLEFADYAIGENVAVTGLTGTSNSAARVAVALIRSDGSCASNVVIQTVSGLDFTFPTVAWSTNVAGNQIIGLADAGTVYFTQDLADWAVSGVVSGTPTISSVTGSGTDTITITIATHLVLNGETITLAYTDSDTNLRDQDGNEAANFTGTAVTNNVSGAAINTITYDTAGALVDYTGTLGATYDTAGVLLEAT